MAIFGNSEKQPPPSSISHQYTIPVILVSIGLFLLSCGGGSSSPSSGPAPGPSPSITSISPTSVSAGSGSFTLIVNGTNFNSSSTVRWNSSNRSTEYVSSAQLNAAISTSDVATGGTRTVTVRNTSPAVIVSNGVAFNVNHPVPTITALNRSSIPAGSEGFTLIIYGRNFVGYSTLLWNGSALSGDYVDETQIAFPLPSSYIASEGIVDVRISNPPPGGGPSNTLPFNVKAPGLYVLTGQMPDAYNSKPYSYTLQAEGGKAPYSWSISAGSLPAGLSLSPEGEISGTAPNVSSDAAYPFTVALEDSSRPSGSNMILHDLGILVKSGSLGRNDSCIAAAATPISNGILHASISPYGDIDVYSFHGMQGNPVTVELFAQRLDLDGDPTGQDIYLDTFLEILDDGCDPIAYNDDIDLGVVFDSMISDYVLPYTGIYHIRVSDLRGDGRPDFLYDLSLSGSD